MAQKKRRGLIDRLMMGSEKSEGYARASLPSNRWELFWDILKSRFGKLMLINILVFLFFLPLLALLLIRYLSIINYGTMYPFSQSFGIGYGALPNMMGVSESIVFSVNVTSYIFMPITLLIAAVGISGGAYVIRNMVWTEGVFVANDFWRGVKQNFKQIAVIMLMFSLVFYITSVSISICNKNIAEQVNHKWLFVLSKVLSYIFVVTYSVMTLHMITMSTNYEVKIRHLLKNSFSFTTALLPYNVFFIAICVIPFLLFLFDGILLILALLLLFIFSFSFVLLVWTNYCQWAYDKFINPKIKGAQKNRGIYEKVKEDNAGALKKYKEQMAMVSRSALTSKPIKPITDEELVIDELPTSFSRKDIQKLNESKQRLVEDHERYVEEHKGDDKYKLTEADIERENARLEREKRIEKAKRELAKRNRKK